MIADAVRFGMDADSIVNLRVAMQVPNDEDETEIWPENWDTVVAFLAVSTQWRVVAIGGGFSAPALIYIGLDYAAVRRRQSDQGYR